MVKIDYKSIGRLISRWVGRARASRTILMIFFFGMTGLSTFTNVARDYLSSSQILFVNSFFIIAVILFMYFADILNFFIHQQRNLQHIQNNFLSPEGSMRMMIRSEQLKILGEYINGDLNKEEFYKKMDEKTQKLIRYYQGGIEI